MEKILRQFNRFQCEVCWKIEKMFGYYSWVARKFRHFGHSFQNWAVKKDYYIWFD